MTEEVEVEQCRTRSHSSSLWLFHRDRQGYTYITFMVEDTLSVIMSGLS